MRRIATTLVLASLVLGALIEAALTPAQGQGVTEFTVFSADSAGFFQAVDEAATGLSSEDYIFEKSPVFDVDSGDRIGTSTTRVQVVKVELEGDDTLSILDSTVSLPGGRLVLSGSFRSGIWQGAGGVGWRGRFAIVGGTGSRAAASGTVDTGAGTFHGMNGTFLHFSIVEA